MKPAAAQARRQPPGAANRPRTPVEALKSTDDSVVTSSTGVSPDASSVAKIGRWELWFDARHAVPDILRPRTKAGKPKRPPPRYPPNINERRAMHWTVEHDTVAFWRGYAFRVARRHEMPLLERARISAKLYRRALGVADGSGDAERLKSLVDGLVDAGVLANDTRRYVEHGPVTEHRTSSHSRGDGLLLIVEALPAPGTEDE